MGGLEYLSLYIYVFKDLLIYELEDTNLRGGDEGEGERGSQEGSWLNMETHMGLDLTALR